MKCIRGKIICTENCMPLIPSEPRKNVVCHLPHSLLNLKGRNLLLSTLTCFIIRFSVVVHLLFDSPASSHSIVESAIILVL